MNDFYVATAIFFLAYAVIITEKIHKTVVALSGAALMLALRIVDQHEAFYSEETGIDYNVVFLLIGMMLIINIMKETGIFQWVAIKSAKLAKGEPFRLLAILSVVTAVLSAFLDNVTTVLLIAPVTLLICDALEMDPFPFLLSEILSSNIGGTATLIGDPPNIMIASKAELTFMNFIFHLAPVVIVIMIVYLLTLRLVFAKKLSVPELLKVRVMSMDESAAITDRPLMVKSLWVMGFTILGFILHHQLHLQPATVALTGAAALLLLSRMEPHKILESVEWPTIFFFIGLFIIIGGVQKVGLIKILSEQVLNLTKGDLFSTSMLVLWFSAFASAIVDNIPYVATMNPLVLEMSKGIWPDLTGHDLLHHVELMPVWWSLALGACLGGNATLIGASANVIVAGIAEKAGHKITFARFLGYGLPFMIQTVLISMLYIWLRYYVFQF
jgi:Na+/H+ antiporter NhaD/arsenite permease-like protein